MGSADQKTNQTREPVAPSWWEHDALHAEHVERASARRARFSSAEVQGPLPTMPLPKAVVGNPSAASDG